MPLYVCAAGGKCTISNSPGSHGHVLTIYCIFCSGLTIPRQFSLSLEVLTLQVQQGEELQLLEKYVNFGAMV